MRHYLFVTDPEGNEIAGSRRSIDHCETREQLAAIERALASASGEGCSIEDNVDDWREFWKARGVT
ncbi:hypothetical protein [Erythrobacter sp. EC-HK427]|uniref:hypothetical protein n=1 Tax=Erythrobacter sp. EC-HK427 TaxID=2038396 RepID=UPI00125F679C|nr:hypothetical protein [Erythrobacter sp. EC-HK427]